jgi:hypothetical protein
MNEEPKPAPKGLFLQDTILMRAMNVSVENKEVRETLLLRTWEGMTVAEREATDCFIHMLTGTGVDNLIAETNENCTDYGARVADSLKGMDTEMKLQYRKISDWLDVFVVEMRERFARKIKEGRKGFDGEALVLPVADEIENRLQRVRDNEDGIGVGIANWSFIHWFRQVSK